MYCMYKYVRTYGERNLGRKLVVDDAAASMIVHSGHGDNTSISAFFLQTKSELQEVGVRTYLYCFLSTEYVRIFKYVPIVGDIRIHITVYRLHDLRVLSSNSIRIINLT